MLTMLSDRDFKQTAIAFATIGWCCYISDYARGIMSKSKGADGEAFLLFLLWGLFLWWLSKRYAGGWTFYWSIFAAVSFAPFADVLGAAFGGVLGLRP